MSGGYRSRTAGDLGELIDQLLAIKRRLDTLEQPDSGIVAQVVDRVVVLEAGEATNDELIDGLSEIVAALELDVTAAEAAVTAIDGRVATLEDTSLDLERAAGAGLILRSPDGTRWRLSVSDAGASEWAVVT